MELALAIKQVILADHGLVLLKHSQSVAVHAVHHCLKNCYMGSSAPGVAMDVVLLIAASIAEAICLVPASP